MNNVRGYVLILYFIVALSFVSSSLVLPLSFTKYITPEKVSIEEAYDTLLSSLTALALVISNVFNLVFLLVIHYSGRLLDKVVLILSRISTVRSANKMLKNILYKRLAVYLIVLMGFIGGVLVLCSGLSYFNGLPFSIDRTVFLTIGILFSSLSLVYFVWRNSAGELWIYTASIAYPLLLAFIVNFYSVFVNGADTSALRLFKLELFGGVLLGSYVLSLASIVAGALIVGYRGRLYGFLASYVLALSVAVLYLIQLLTLSYILPLTRVDRAVAFIDLDIESFEKLGYLLFAPEYVNVLHIVFGVLLIIGWLDLLINRSLINE